VNPQASHRPVPAPEKLVLICQAVKAATFEGIVLDVTAAAFLLAVLLGIAGAGGQGREAPVPGEGLIDHIDVWVIETCPYDCSLHIVMPMTFGTPPRSVKAFSCRRRKVSTV